MEQIILLIKNKKGLESLRALIGYYTANIISFVVSEKDFGVVYDYHFEVAELCRLNNIKLIDKKYFLPQDYKDNYKLCIGWSYLVSPPSKVIVIHDSLLPKYKGFNPLPSMLINSETKIGISSFLANDQYDEGPLLLQDNIDISYPITISDAIDRLIPLYVRQCIELYNQINSNQLRFITPISTDSSYSMWRDKLDYFIDWNKDAEYISRFIDSVGYPYDSAKTHLDGKLVKIISAKVYSRELKIENPTAGKIFRIEDGNPIVLTGKGLLVLTRIEELNGDVIYPIKKLKVRFI